MTATAQILLSVLVVLVAYFAWRWWRAARASVRQGESAKPGVLRIAIGFVTNFFDTLGIGSFAPTTSVFKFLRVVFQGIRKLIDGRREPAMRS